MIECICRKKHQRHIDGRKRPVWFEEGDTTFFDECPPFFEPIEEYLGDELDLMTIPSEILYDGKVDLETIKTFVKEKFKIDLGKKQLKASVDQLVYARENVISGAKTLDDIL